MMIDWEYAQNFNLHKHPPSMHVRPAYSHSFPLYSAHIKILFCNYRIYVKVRIQMKRSSPDSFG